MRLFCLSANKVWTFEKTWCKMIQNRKEMIGWRKCLTSKAGRKPERRANGRYGNDKQLNGFVRFLLDALKDAMEEKESEKKDEKLAKIADNLQKTLED